MLDADDWYLPNRLENLFLKAEMLNADLVCDNLSLYDHSLGCVVGTMKFGSKVMPFTKIKLFQLENRRHPVGFSKPMIRSSFIKKHEITYNSHYRLGEDYLFLAEIILSGAKAFLIPTSDYVYVHRTSPSTWTSSPDSRADKGCSNINDSCDALIKKFGDTMTDDEKRALANKKKANGIFQDYLDFLAMKHKKNYRAAFLILINKPQIFLLKLRLIKFRLQDKLMVRISKIRSLGNTFPTPKTCLIPR